MNPVRRRHLVINIAIDAWVEAGSAVALQCGVEVAATLAEVIEGRIPEREHGEFHAAEPQAVAVHYGLPEWRSILGRFTVPGGYW